MSADVAIRRITAEETVPLRHAVLWPDHPVSHVLLPEDASGYHYGAFLPDTSTPVAVISVFYDPLPVHPSPDAPSDTSAKAARFRKFACDPEHQGRGIGTKLLKHVFDTAAAEMGCGVIWCDARMSAAGWYERRGMRKVGDMFYKGDIEYVRMMRDLVATES
ncbi:acyl-CoA N-acyltransferase [Lentinus brumalis]|uniref:Acyl-CoA N-acyltransferase n=1 Tax=Lentinus brumalis TaxID=2498619 RepID=A0A371D895_9APHY|nr:acyl-CoA N-acyltransferase [Polyporus brumalis]